MITLKLTRKEAYQLGVALQEFHIKVRDEGNWNLLEDVKVIVNQVTEKITKFDVDNNLDIMDLSEVLYD